MPLLLSLNLVTILLINFLLISKMSALTLVGSIIVGYIVFKEQYMSLKSFYKKHLNTIDSLLPYYLKSLEMIPAFFFSPV